METDEVFHSDSDCADSLINSDLDSSPETESKIKEKVINPVQTAGRSSGASKK